MRPSLASFLAALLLSACATGGSIVQQQKPAFTTRPDLATLVVVRPTSFGFGVTVDNYLDGRRFGVTRGKSFNMVQVPPGQHYVMSRAENVATARIFFEPGKIYFLHQGILPGVWKARTILSTLSLEEGLAKADSSDCDYRVLDPAAEPRDMTQDQFDRARNDFEADVLKDPERFRASLEYRGFYMPGSPVPAAPLVPVAQPAPAPGAQPAPAAAPAAAPSCTKDVDCPGSAVCQYGACVPPAGPPAPVAAPPPAAGPTLPCTKDTDCPGNDICSAGACRPGR